MNDRSERIDKITAEFKSTFGPLTTEQLNWKPDSNSWSIAQNIEHLIVINETYDPIIKALKAGTLKLPLISKAGFMVSFFGKAILKSVKPDGAWKIKTFTNAQPSQSYIDGDIIKKFEIHQEWLKKLIESCGDLIKKQAVIYSPANKNIVYKLETAFEIIVAHESRHFEQAKRVLMQMNF